MESQRPPSAPVVLAVPEARMALDCNVAAMLAGGLLQEAVGHIHRSLGSEPEDIFAGWPAVGTIAVDISLLSRREQAL